MFRTSPPRTSGPSSGSPTELAPPDVPNFRDFFLAFPPRPQHRQATVELGFARQVGGHLLLLCRLAHAWLRELWLAAHFACRRQRRRAQGYVPKRPFPVTPAPILQGERELVACSEHNLMVAGELMNRLHSEKAEVETWRLSTTSELAHYRQHCAGYADEDGMRALVRLQSECECDDYARIADFVAIAILAQKSKSPSVGHRRRCYTPGWSPLRTVGMP